MVEDHVKTLRGENGNKDKYIAWSVLIFFIFAIFACLNYAISANIKSMENGKDITTITTDITELKKDTKERLDKFELKLDDFLKEQRNKK